MKKIYLLLLLAAAALRGYGQDHLYSQFYNAPNYLNPALNGQFDGDFRVNLIYRNQWSSIPGPLNYYSFSADLNVPSLNGGLGLMMTKSSEGSAYLNKTNFSGIYSYSVEFDENTLSFGLQAGVTNRKVDADKLIYLDQLNDQGIIPGGGSAGSAPLFNNRFFFDAGAGINLVLGNSMLGASGQHLNRPNETLTGVYTPLARRFNFYASYKWLLDPYDEENSPSLVPSVVLYRQAGVSSFSAGAQFKHRGVNIGLWYRGDGVQQDALVISVIFDLFSGKTDDHIRLGLSHDATTSKLNYSRTAGTTEGAFSYETTLPGRDQPYARSGYGKKCYDFY